MYLNLLRPSGHPRPGYCAVPDSISQIFYCATLSQTDNQGIACKLYDSPVSTYYTAK